MAGGVGQGKGKGKGSGAGKATDGGKNKPKAVSRLVFSLIKKLLKLIQDHNVPAYNSPSVASIVTWRVKWLPMVVWVRLGTF